MSEGKETIQIPLKHIQNSDITQIVVFIKGVCIVYFILVNFTLLKVANSFQYQ